MRMNITANQTLLLIFCVITACAHPKSGWYVFENGQWKFKSSRVGFMYAREDFGRIDHSHYDFAEDGEFIWPVPGSKKVSSYFGNRKGRHHDGIDIPAISGTHIVASAGGVVSVAGTMKGYGNVIVIKHGNGHHTVYAHNSKHFVKKGQSVSQGEVIAQVGSSGRSTGPHLHFEIRKENRVRNPKLYLARLKNH